MFKAVKGKGITQHFSEYDELGVLIDGELRSVKNEIFRGGYCEIRCFVAYFSRISLLFGL